MRPIPRSPILKALYSLFLLTASAANSALLEGQVTSNDDRAIAGAIITVFDKSGLDSETVYSDASGNFYLQTRLSGDVTVRVRTPYFEDKTQSFTLLNNDKNSLSVQVNKLVDPLALSQSLTASAFAAKIEFADKPDGTAFRSQCHYCHQMGNTLTRQLKTEEQWEAVIDRMQSYGALITVKNERAFKSSLLRAFNDEPIKAIQTWDVSAELPRAVFKEWAIGDARSYIHDIDIGPDNKLYGVDMGNDKLYILDPATNQKEIINFPPSDLPLGGLFAGAIAPLGTFFAKHGPHSIQSGPQGKLWITNSLATEIMAYDPLTRKFKIYPIGEDAIYPHTLRFDSQGILWFTLALSNQIGRFDPATEQFTIIDTPSHGAMRWLTDALLPALLKFAALFPKQDLQLTLSHHKISGEGYKIFNLPYGIDVNPIDGSIWYSKLYSSYIGRLDPVTQTVEEFKTPLKGPRRLRFDRAGMLWIPSFEESALMRFDPEAREFKLFPLPVLAPGEYETPYAVGIHPRTQDIWITSNLSDRIFRFLPDEERFISYPSPTRVAFLREIVFMDDGGVCSSNSNLPASAIEGGLQKILCIYPDANQSRVQR
jgi:sugar lactone lactonase YvrE